MDQPSMSSNSVCTDSDDDKLIIDMEAEVEIITQGENLSRMEENSVIHNKIYKKKKRTMDSERIEYDLADRLFDRPSFTGSQDTSSVYGQSTRGNQENNTKANMQSNPNRRPVTKRRQTVDHSKNESRKRPRKMSQCREETYKNMDELRKMMERDYKMYLTNMWHTFNDIRNLLTNIILCTDNTLNNSEFRNERSSAMREQILADMYGNVHLNLKYKDQKKNTTSHIFALGNAITAIRSELERLFVNFLKDCELRMESSSREMLMMPSTSQGDAQDSNGSGQSSSNNMQQFVPPYSQIIYNTNPRMTSQVPPGPSTTMKNGAGLQMPSNPPVQQNLPDENIAKRLRETPVLQKSTELPLIPPATQFQNFGLITNPNAHLPQHASPITEPYAQVNPLNSYPLPNQFPSHPRIEYNTSDVSPGSSMAMLPQHQNGNDPQFNAPYMQVGSQLPQNQVNNFQYYWMTQPMSPTVQMNQGNMQLGPQPTGLEDHNSPSTSK